MAGSHRMRSMWVDNRRARLGPAERRLTQEQVDAVLAYEPERLHTLTAPAGTLVLAATSAIHRGKPIEAGVRYALTNYYFPRRMMTPRRMKKFAPLVPYA